MKQAIFALLILMTGVQCTPNQDANTTQNANAEDNTVIEQNDNIEEEITQLSKQKWQWMADKNVQELAKLFDDKSKFVHMSGSWKKTENSKS